MAKQILNWVNKIISIVLVMILLLLLYYAISSKVNGGKPSILGYELLTVLSGSMEPKIPTGSIIAVKPIENPRDLKVGDVITFKPSDSAQFLITHRIIGIEEEGSLLSFITQGDNNNTPDPEPIPASNVVAKYENIMIPFLGYLFSFASTKLGIILLIIIPGVILVLSQLVNVWKLFAKMDDEENPTEESIQQST